MSTSTTDYAMLQTIAMGICETVEEKGKAYGDSWKARGGAGAFMVMARKWDRIENICKANGYNIFNALNANEGGIQDDVQDLIGYLLLILEETTQQTPASVEFPWGAPQSPVQLLITTNSNDYWTNEGYYGDETELYKCRACGATQRHRGTPAQPHGCAQF